MDWLIAGLAFASLAFVGVVAQEVMIEPPENLRNVEPVSDAVSDSALGGAEEGISALQQQAPDGRPIRMLVSVMDRTARVLQNAYMGPVLVCEPQSLTGLELAFRAESIQGPALPVAHATFSVRHSGLAVHPSTAASWISACTLRLGRAGASMDMPILTSSVLDKDITCQPDVLYIGMKFWGARDLYLERGSEDVVLALV